MKDLSPPKNRAGAPGKECAHNSDTSFERTSQLTGHVKASDFAERVRQADADALRKGKL
jgi:hypothetical protein